MSVTTKRKNGEQTCFEFNENLDRHFDRAITSLRRTGMSEAIIAAAYYAAILQRLRDGDAVSGFWFSSDFDSDAVENDIANKIRTDAGFKISVTIYGDDRHAIRRPCKRGQFLAMRARS